MNEYAPTLRIPAATYRVQFNKTFGFADAKLIIPYLHDLGITDFYASPYFKAKPGSLHGYDIVDPTRLNPEVGTEAQYKQFSAELTSHGMGQILDIVPNHMCNESDNPWWMDMLENGPSSIYAPFFDIHWTPEIINLTNKVLLPLLGEQYGKTLEKRELELIFEEGGFFIRYYENRFPVLPETYLQPLEHRLDELKYLLPEDDPHLTELLSINTALRHLPQYTETDPEKVTERYREKEIIKKRLGTLYGENPDIRAFIDANVARFNGVVGDARSFDLLDRLLDGQIWRPSHWRVATEEINYRRFFDINSIAALHMEDPQVFAQYHQLIFRLVAEGKATGLRVDHLDGLYSPIEYLGRLQQGCLAALGARGAPSYAGSGEGGPEAATVSRQAELLPEGPEARPFYMLCEKILTKGERLNEKWPVFGTTGYSFLNQLNGLFVESKNALVFDRLYSRFIKTRINFPEAAYENRKLVMLSTMSGEINTLGHFLNNIAKQSRYTRDFTLNSLTRAIVEVIAFFPVYRTYINHQGVMDQDRQYLDLAVAKAKHRNPAINASIFDFLKSVLLLQFPEDLAGQDREAWLDFTMKFQQATGPVMAKGVEDTAFYVYNRLVSLNEVGGSPERFGVSLEAFHGQNIERGKHWPLEMIATSTHDTKRSEDVRARINVLSEVPAAWREALIKWSRINKHKKPFLEGQAVPDRNEEYLFYQTLIGAWPVEPSEAAEYTVLKDRVTTYMVKALQTLIGAWPVEPSGAAAYTTLKDRIITYMIKALREAKINTSWINPDSAYEQAVASFIDAVMASRTFVRDFVPFQKRISHFGMFNSLSQTLLKITSPGIPDFYQGSELWRFNLVDPDNRGPVDYEKRIRMLAGLQRRDWQSARETPVLARELTVNKEDGRIKLYLTYKALNFRRDNRELFEAGEYLPLEARGGKVDHVCAFARKLQGSLALVIAPRFYTTLAPDVADLPLGLEVWQDTMLVLPAANAGATFRNIFTDETVAAAGRNGEAILYLGDILANFPVALWHSL